MFNTLVFLLLGTIPLLASIGMEKKDGVPILNEFKNKIVYTLDASTDVETLKADCQERGGEFNTCGSTCDESLPDPVVCLAVCAFTCEFNK